MTLGTLQMRRIRIMDEQFFQVDLEHSNEAALTVTNHVIREVCIEKGIGEVNKVNFAVPVDDKETAELFTSIALAHNVKVYWQG